MQFYKNKAVRFFYTKYIFYMKQVIVSSSPVLFEHYIIPETIVVIIDAIRMSATVCTALANGANEVIPVAGIEATKAYREKGYLIAGEREANKIEGFDFGNSPFEFTKEKVKGQKLAISTTNGTQVISHVQEQAKESGKVEELIIGSFLNISAIEKYLLQKDKNVLIQCSGWKNTVSTEDIMFAGLLTERLLESEKYYHWRDGAFLAQQIYQQAKNNMFNYLLEASPRFKKKINLLEKDIKYCLSIDLLKNVPVLDKEGVIKNAK